MAREITTEELAKRIDDPSDRFVLLDTLPRASYANRHLPGAISLPLDEVESNAERLLPDKDVELIAYCASPG